MFDSINYYARDLADMNDKIAIMQRENVQWPMLVTIQLLYRNG